MERIGVNIVKGPQSWQIIQQQGGYGTVRMSGKFFRGMLSGACCVWARVVREENGEPILDWSRAQTEKNGTWNISLSGIPAGGLYRLETCLKSEENYAFSSALRGDLRHHIGIGDLYVIAGQSNAAGFAQDAVADPPELGIHVFRTSGRWELASHPLNDFTDAVHTADQVPERQGHSPYLSFARFLKRELGYPVGLIPTAYGGSSIRSWLPGTEGILYRNMMETIVKAGSGIAGILWYQGCRDASEKDYKNYGQLFEKLVNGVREKIGFDVPFYSVQLNRRTDQVEDEWNDGWTFVREAQRQAAKTLPEVYIVPSIDGTMSDWIHNSAVFNLVLGERIGKVVLAKHHNRKFNCDAPDLKSAVVKGQSLTLTFSPVVGCIDTLETKAEQLLFRISDDEGPIAVVSYELRRDGLVLRLERKPCGSCFVENAYGADPHGVPAFDSGTHYPILAFGKEPVKVLREGLGQ